MKIVEHQGRGTFSICQLLAEPGDDEPAAHRCPAKEWGKELRREWIATIEACGEPPDKQDWVIVLA
jgi:hypothetical protein